jgi:hypothetical protein
MQPATHPFEFGVGKIAQLHLKTRHQTKEGVFPIVLTGIPGPVPIRRKEFDRSDSIQ